MRNEFKLDKDGVRRRTPQAVPDTQESKGLEAAGKVWRASWENPGVGPLGSMEMRCNQILAWQSLHLLSQVALTGLGLLQKLQAFEMFL